MENTQISKPSKCALVSGAIFLFLAVALGAFGAHGLKEIVVGKYLETYKTGVTYQFYHALSLLIIGLISIQIKELGLKSVLILFSAGILFFSFNCYIYALTTKKIFAMLVPIGGVFFLAGWVTLIYKLLKLETK